jgi:HSP90 family molecular chaperone
VQQPKATPLAVSHFHIEGDVEFHAILYIPPKCPWDFYDTFHSRKPSVSLFAQRVLVSDGDFQLLPKYLRWLVGVVDGQTLPLHVSREMLQQHSSMVVIRKKLVRPDANQQVKLQLAQEMLQLCIAQ